VGDILSRTEPQVLHRERRQLLGGNLDRGSAVGRLKHALCGAPRRHSHHFLGDRVVFDNEN
jgi:hypothetical protein